eukprot:2236927-Ditylum_brightwellii.AAC.1
MQATQSGFQNFKIGYLILHNTRGMECTMCRSLTTVGLAGNLWLEEDKSYNVHFSGAAEHVQLFDAGHGAHQSAIESGLMKNL